MAESQSGSKPSYAYDNKLCLSPEFEEVNNNVVEARGNFRAKGQRMVGITEEGSLTSPQTSDNDSLSSAEPNKEAEKEVNPPPRGVWHKYADDEEFLQAIYSSGHSSESESKPATATDTPPQSPSPHDGRRRRSGVRLTMPPPVQIVKDVHVDDPETDANQSIEHNVKTDGKTSNRLDEEDSEYNVYDTITSQVTSVTSGVDLGAVSVNFGTHTVHPLDRFFPDGGKLLALMYGANIVLIGLVLPLKEALQQTWLTSYVEALFLLYLYGVSFIFIVFLEIYLVQRARRHGHKYKEHDKKPKIIIRDTQTVESPTVVGDNENSIPSASNEVPLTPKTRVHRISVITPPSVNNGLVPQHKISTISMPDQNMLGPRRHRISTISTPGDIVNGPRKISTANSPHPSPRVMQRISITTKPSSPLAANGNMPQHKISTVSVPRHKISTVSSPNFQGISGFSFPQEDAISMASDNNVEVFILEPEHDDHPHVAHQTSLYLRFGAVIFGLGNMIYDGLLIKQIQTGTGGCLDNQFVWPHYVHLVYLLAQTHFIFKHTEIHVTVVKPLARFGFMHLLATNTCIWIRTLIREILDGFLHHSDALNHHASDAHDSHSDPYDIHDVSNKTFLYNTTETPLYEPKCDLHEDIMMQAAPYLFPCVLEYSMLAIAVTYSMFADVGSKSKITKEERAQLQEERDEFKKMNPNSDVDDEPLQPSHVHVTMIDFHKSHSGLFLGIVLIAATCVSTALFFSYVGSDPQQGEIIYHSTLIGLLSFALLFVLWAGFKMQKLKYFSVKSASVDDVLLMVSMAGMILYNELKMSPAISYLSQYEWYNTEQILSVLESLLAIIVAILQTIFLLNVSHRFTHTKKLFKTKPGRGAVTCLLLINIALWLFRTFNMKEVEIAAKLQEEAYGYLAWQLFSHALIPLLIFYHYHASACFAHIWSNTYRSDTIREDVETNVNHDVKENEKLKRKKTPASAETTINSADELKPDKIIEFKRHGKAPKTPRTSTGMNIPVIMVEAPSTTTLDQVGSSTA